MDYQTLIETTHEMATTPEIIAALEDGKLIGVKESEWAGMTPEQIIEDIKSELEPKTCAHCGMFDVSDDHEIAEQMLCDHCYDEVNDYEIVGWRKGE